MALPHSGANNASPETIRSALDRIVSRQQFPSDADYNAFVAAQPATADKIVMPPNERVDLEKMRQRHFTESVAAVVLNLADHEGNIVVLDNAGPGATVDVGAFAVAKANGEPVEVVEIHNVSANSIGILNGSGGIASIESNAVVAVKSIASNASVTMVSGGWVD